MRSLLEERQALADLDGPDLSALFVVEDHRVGAVPDQGLPLFQGKGDCHREEPVDLEREVLRFRALPREQKVQVERLGPEGVLEVLHSEEAGSPGCRCPLGVLEMGLIVGSQDPLPLARSLQVEIPLRVLEPRPLLVVEDADVLSLLPAPDGGDSGVRLGIILEGLGVGDEGVAGPVARGPGQHPLDVFQARVGRHEEPAEHVGQIVALEERLVLEALLGLALPEARVPGLAPIDVAVHVPVEMSDVARAVDDQVVDLPEEGLGEVIVAVVAPAEIAGPLVAVEIHMRDAGLVEKGGRGPSDQPFLHGPIGEQRLVGMVHELLVLPRLWRAARPRSRKPPGRSPSACTDPRRRRPGSGRSPCRRGRC